MAVKKNDKGRYLRKVGYLDIRAKDEFKRGVAVGKFGKDPVNNTQINLYHAKEKVGGPFKNIELAIEEAKKIMGEKYCKIYNL